MAKRKAEIARLVSEGLTDTEIAAALGITRNAAIGARHRMGLAGNNRLRPNGEPRARPVRSSKNEPAMDPLERQARRKAARKMGLIKDPQGLRLPDDLWEQCLPKPTQAPPAPIESAPAIEVPKPKKAASEPIQPAKKPTFWHPVLTLTEYTCRWPKGEIGAEDFHYCCAWKPLEEAFCDHHRAMAYAPRHGRAA